MGSRRWHKAAGLAVWFLLVQTVCGQPQNPHVGYVYPAGGQQGTTFEAIVAGQGLTGAEHIDVSGDGVQGTVTELVRPISPKELNELRIEVDELLARKAVVRGDFRALEQFRSFKNAKSVDKKANESDDQELEQLKKKYAGAKWTDDDDRKLQDVRKKMSSSVRRPANPAISELAVVRITIAPDAEPGQRELRIASKNSLSNPLFFHVGKLAEFTKPLSKVITERTSDVAKTSSAPRKRAAPPEATVTLPTVVNGQIMPGAVDRFRFQARKGQELVAVAQARQLIPYIPDAVPGWFQATLALFDSQGNELAYEDDYRFDPDPMIHCRIPADGEYSIEIKDAIYRGREDFVYRITVGEQPFISSMFPLGGRTGEKTTVELQGWNLPAGSLTIDNQGRGPGVYPLSTGQETAYANSLFFAVDDLPECLEKESDKQPAVPQQVPFPVIVNGRIGKPDDEDLFEFDGKAGTTVVAEIQARRLKSPLDSIVTIEDAAGQRLATNNDFEDKGAGLLTHQADSWLSFTLPKDGAYRLRVTDAEHQGGPEFAYRLRISQPRPDFELRVVPSTLNARAGATLPVTVYALRRDGFSDDITISLQDTAPACKLSGGRIPAGQDEVRMTLTFLESQDQPFNVRIKGRANIGGREVSHTATPAEDMMQAFAYRHLVPVQQMRVAYSPGGPMRGMAMRIVSDLPLKLTAGSKTTLQFAAPFIRNANQFELQLADPPEGITLEKVDASSDGVSLVLNTDAAKVKPGQAGNLIVVAAPKRSGNAKAKAPMNRLTPVATLPAVPFQVVAAPKP
jgi:hypothetical protein